MGRAVRLKNNHEGRGEQLVRIISQVELGDGNSYHEAHSGVL